MERRKFIQLGAAGTVIGASTPSLLSCSQGKLHTVENFELKTPLCNLLNIKYPIIQAGMGNVAGPELVAAVCNAGGLGILSGTMIPPNVLKKQIQKIRELTDKPFGVNLLLQKDLYPPSDFDISNETVRNVQGLLNKFRSELGIPESYDKPDKLPPLIQLAFEIILQENVPVFSVGLGNPTKEMVEQCHAKGIKVIAMISTLEDALSVNANGVDVIIAQGSEAGGHRSTWEKKSSKEYAAIGTLPLTSSVVNSVKIPVVAAGGIVNGKGLKAALSLGAQGVLIGTRFVASKESIAPESYKQKLLVDSSDNTIITDVFTGMYARVLRNTFTETYTNSNTHVFPPGRQYFATMDIIKAAGTQENTEFYTLYAGQGIDEIIEIKTAEAIVRDIIKEANG